MTHYAGLNVALKETAIPCLNKALTRELAGCEFIDRRESVIALGASGNLALAEDMLRQSRSLGGDAALASLRQRMADR